MFDEKNIQSALYSCWSPNSSSLWTPTNPAKGQCSVTALVIHSLFGGKIVKTVVGGANHFYNRINERYYDLTSCQFESPPKYLNIVSSREEAMLDTNVEQFEYLRNTLVSYLKERRNFVCDC